MNRLVIKSCVVGDRFSMITSDFDDVDCNSSIFEYVQIRDFKSAKQVSFDDSRINKDMEILKAEITDLFMRRTYVYHNLVLSTDEQRLSVSSCVLTDITVEGDFRCIGITAESVDLSEGRMGTVYMSGCNIGEKGLKMDEIKVRNECTLSHSKISGDVGLSRSRIMGKLNVSGPGEESSFDSIDLRYAFIQYSANLSNCRCKGMKLDNIDVEELLVNGSEVNGSVSVCDSKIVSLMSMEATTVYEVLKLDGSVAKKVILDDASIKKLSMKDAGLQVVSAKNVSVEEIWMDGFHGEDTSMALRDYCKITSALFTDMQIGSSFQMKNAYFACRPSFNESRFGKGVELVDITLTDGADFSKAVFSGNSTFSYYAREKAFNIDMSYTSFQSTGGIIIVSLMDQSDGVSLNLTGMFTNSQIYFRGLRFDRFADRFLSKVLFRIFGYDTTAFCNLWKGGDDWECLENQWAVLERIYSVRNDITMQKDAYVWKKFCERRRLNVPVTTKGV